MDKSVIDETHPNFVGMYAGAWSQDGVRNFVEEADCVIAMGTLPSDFNTGAFTAKIDRSKIINISHHRTRVGYARYDNVEMKDILAALTKQLPKRNDLPHPRPTGLGAPQGSGEDSITSEALYPRWERFFRPGDVVVAESGTCALGLSAARLPAGATLHNQTLWGAIGWATPAAFGAALAAPNRRTVLITGEGSHQLTVQEVSQFHRFGLKPIVFVLNNHGYLIERLLGKHPGIYYNDLAQWNYYQLPQALGCEGWFTSRVTTCGELDAALAKAESCGTGAYIEVVTGKFAAPPLAIKMHESTKTLYKA
jgi:indolepyruvate decarboxylase